MRIYLVMNISQVVQYQKPMKEQSKPVEVDRKEEQEVEKILNKRKKNLENTKKIVAKFKRRLSIKVRQQEKAETVREEDFRSRELPGRYTTKMLHGQNNEKFKKEYLKKLERNQQRQKSVFLEDKP